MGSQMGIGEIRHNLQSSLSVLFNFSKNECLLSLPSEIFSIHSGDSPIEPESIGARLGMNLFKLSESNQKKIDLWFIPQYCCRGVV